MASQRRALVGILALLVLTYAAYAPGLGGGFLFDDFVNLNAIGATGAVDNWSAFFRYITSGTADPTGRPLALLSFLIDARDWPAEPASFLRTNLILHLINGALLFVLLRMLGHRLDAEDRRADAAALLATGLWLLHPLFVSTTLYVVQREAMLPATFILLGLLAYFHGRAIIGIACHPRGAAWMVGGIVGGTTLATLCKGNGILLPMLAWVLEATIWRREDNFASISGTSWRMRWFLLGLPSLTVILYLLSFLPALNAPLETRDWTIGQRLLTEPRVITDYLQLLIVPRSVSTGLYNDAYVVSTGLLQPWNTLPCLLLVLLLPYAAWRYRTRFPRLSAAVLFFFAAHLLESSIIPLELYFEHRNYLPAMLLFWPLAHAVCASKLATRWRVLIASGLIGVVLVSTIQRVWLWGQPQVLAALWARQNPQSSRAQATVAMMDVSAGQPQRALDRLGPLWKARPHDLQIAFNYVNAACAYRGLSADDSRALANALEHADSALHMVHGWMSKSIEAAAFGQCAGLTLADTEAWLAATLRNPGLSADSTRGQDIEPLLALLAIHRHQPELALHHFNIALRAFTTPDVAARQASLLASNGYYEQALAHLDAYERLRGQVQRPRKGMPYLHAKVLEWQGYWAFEMAVLRAKLHGEIEAKPDAGDASDK
ncbi:MAG: tetratricopeptide repeat protein [Arenimonas sp.]|jgi:hypothetical protein